MSSIGFPFVRGLSNFGLLNKQDAFKRQTVTPSFFQQAALPSSTGGLFGRQSNNPVSVGGQPGLSTVPPSLSQELLNIFAGGAKESQLSSILGEQSADIPEARNPAVQSAPQTVQFGGK